MFLRNSMVAGAAFAVVGLALPVSAGSLAATTELDHVPTPIEIADICRFDVSLISGTEKDTPDKKEVDDKNYDMSTVFEGAKVTVTDTTPGPNQQLGAPGLEFAVVEAATCATVYCGAEASAATLQGPLCEKEDYPVATSFTGGWLEGPCKLEQVLLDKTVCPAVNPGIDPDLFLPGGQDPVPRDMSAISVETANFSGQPTSQCGCRPFSAALSDLEKLFDEPTNVLAIGSASSTAFHSSPGCRSDCKKIVCDSSGGTLSCTKKERKFCITYCDSL